MKIIWPAMFFTMLAVSSYATSVTITNTNLQSKSGILHSIYFETASGPGTTTPATNTALTPSGTSGSYSIAAGTNGFLWSPAFASSTTVPSSQMTFDIWASASSVSPPGLDGSASASVSAGTIITISLTTTKSNDLLYVSIVDGNSFTVSSITSSPSLTWTQRLNIAFSSSRDLETWYAIWSSSGTITITITLTGSTFGAAVAYGISGANTASPFDTNALIPRSASGTAGTTATVTISTSSANDFIIGAAGILGNPALTTGTGFTLVLTQTVGTGANARETSDEFQTVSTTQTNLAVSYSWTGTQDWAIIGDAVVGSAQASLTLRTTDSAGTLVSTLLSSTNGVPVLATQTQTTIVFSISSGSIPAGGYLEVIITAPSTASITVFWGVGQPTNFQVPRVVLT